MKLFGNYKFTWWQVGIFKLSLLCIGAAIGAYWSEFFGEYLTTLLVVGVVCALYIWYIAIKR